MFRVKTLHFYLAYCNSPSTDLHISLNVPQRAKTWFQLNVIHQTIWEYVLNLAESGTLNFSIYVQQVPNLLLSRCYLKLTLIVSLASATLQPGNSINTDQTWIMREGCLYKVAGGCFFFGKGFQDIRYLWTDKSPSCVVSWLNKLQAITTLHNSLTFGY